MSTTREKNDLLAQKSEEIFRCGGEKAVARQHELGKLTARERLEQLFDRGTFTEIDRFVEHRCTAYGMQGKTLPADAVVVGYGKVEGRTVFAYAQDFTVSGGSLGEMHAAKICKVMDMAAAAGAPIVGINDSGGARIQEGIDALSGFGEIFRRNSLFSGRIPQITLIMGPCAGGAVYSPALTDFVIMLEKKSQMFITGPSVIEQITGEEVSAEELGGADTHTMTSGVAHFSAASEEEVFSIAKTILRYLPSNSSQKAEPLPYVPADESRPLLDEIVPDSPAWPYDIKDVIEQIADPDSFFETQPLYADNIVTGFCRVAGRSAGVIANQPFSCGGALDINASDKAARFIQFCDAFNLPLLTLVDVPGFLPGIEQETGGIIRHGAKLLYVYSVAEVPKITVVLRKAYGGAYIGMCSKGLGADLVMAWPTAEIAVMGAEGAAKIIFRKEIREAEDPRAMYEQKIREYNDRFATPYAAAAHGYIDMVIHPSETRARIIEALEVFADKKRDGRIRGNMPL